MAKQDEPSLFLFNPAVHAGAGDVTRRLMCRELAFATDPYAEQYMEGSGFVIQELIAPGPLAENDEEEDDEDAAAR